MNKIMQERQEFVGHYLDAVLTEIGDHCGIAEECGDDCPGGHTPRTVRPEELSTEAAGTLRMWASRFFDAHRQELMQFPGNGSYGPGDWLETGAYYAWMASQGHGVGFGDWYVSGGLTEMQADARDKLMEATRYNERDVYLGTDGKIHVSAKTWREMQEERSAAH